MITDGILTVDNTVYSLYGTINENGLLIDNDHDAVVATIQNGQITVEQYTCENGIMKLEILDRGDNWNHSVIIEV
jgi:hypothetical protein